MRSLLSLLQNRTVVTVVTFLEHCTFKLYKKYEGHGHSKASLLLVREKTHSHPLNCVISSVGFQKPLDFCP